MNDKFELENENIFESIVGALPDFVAIVLDEKFLYLNLMGQSLLKCSNLCEIVGESVYTFIDPGNHEVIRALLAGEIDSDENNPLQIKIRTAAGDPILLQVTLKYFVWNDSRAMIIVGRSVSEELTQKCAINKSKDETKLSELYYREVFDYSSESLFLLEVLEDSDFRILDINPQFEKTVGLAREILIDKAISAIVSTDLVSIINTKFQSCVAARAEIETEIELDLSVGLRIFRAKLVPIFDESGNVCRINGVLWDVAGREKVESNLDEEFELFVGGQNVAYKCRYIDGWSVEFVSPNVFDRFGYTQEDLMDGKISVVDIIHADDLLRVNEEIEYSIESMVSYIEQEFRIACKDGRYILVHTFTVFAKDAGGNVTHLKGYLRDITGRKKKQDALFEAEEQKNESERRYREMFDNSHDSILLLEVLEDSQFRLLEINAQCEREIGLKREESVGKFLDELAAPESAKIAREKYQKCIELGVSIEELAELEMPKGLRFIHTVLVPVRDKSGRIYRIISLARDVTDQYKTKQQLELNRNLLDNAEVVASVGHFYMDFSNDEFYCSRGIYSILEVPYKEDLVENLDVFQFVHPDDIFRVKKSLLYASNNKTKFNKVHRVIDSNGVEKMVRSSATFIIDSLNRELLIGSMQDVSDLYSLKDQVVIGEEKLRLLAENSPIGLFVMNGETPVYINQSLLKLLGAGSLSEFVKINIYDLVYPADRCSVVKLKEKIFNGDIADALSCQLTIRFLDHNGGLKILDLRFIACCLEGDRYLQIMVIDITDEMERETLMNQLTSDSLYLSKKKDIIASVKNELNDILINGDYKKSDFRNIINLLDSYSKDDSEWGFFNTYFENLHPGLISNLKIICPTLTLNDIKHCACIRLNIDTKETARFFNVTPASIQTSRVRLKKKLNLPESVDLREFIENL